MKRKKSDVLRLVAELRSDMSVLDDLTRKNKKAWQRIDELRPFRHIFRNIYQSELDPKRVKLVQQRLDVTLSAFGKAHEAFVKKVKTIADQLED